MTQPKLFNKTLDDRFAIWVHTACGREVSGQFIRAACGLQKAGWKRYGGKRICEGLRWNIDLKCGPDAEGFKVNNSMISRLVRHAEIHAPELANGFFEKRMLKS